MMQNKKSKFLIAGILSFGVLAGCSGVQYAMDNYRGIKPQKIAHNGQTFRVFDKPEEGRMMITPSLGKAALQGATFGAAATAEMTFQGAAETYLEITGRQCEVGDPKLVVQPQYEVFYRC